MPRETIDAILKQATRAPSAGNTKGWSFLVLDTPEDVKSYWTHDASPEWLARPNHPGILRAPIIVLPLTSEQAYRQRFAEDDKPTSSPGNQEWAVPYWWVDIGFASMLVMLGVIEAKLGAAFLAQHKDLRPFLDTRGVPSEWSAVGAIVIGFPDGKDQPSPSLRRPSPPLAEVVRYNVW